MRYPHVSLILSNIDLTLTSQKRLGLKTQNIKVMVKALVIHLIEGKKGAGMKTQE